MKSLLSLAIAAAIALTGYAQGPNALDWDVKVRYVNSDIEAQKTYLLYGTQPSIELSWMVRIEGTGLVTFIPVELARRMAVDVRANERPVETISDWESSVTVVSGGEVVTLGSQGLVTLRPGDRLHWNATLARRDGRAWSGGEYRAAVDLDAAMAAIHEENPSWKGRSQSKGVFSFRIDASNSTLVRKMVHTTDATRAFEAKDFARAASIYRRMLAENPADGTPYGPLAMALMADGQFRQAAEVYERLLVLYPEILKMRDRIGAHQMDSLAYAYTALGDRQNAARALALIYPQPQVEERLKELQERAARDPKARALQPRR